MDPNDATVRLAHCQLRREFTKGFQRMEGVGGLIAKNLRASSFSEDLLNYAAFLQSVR